jgi:hypothetical protein
MSTLGTSPPLFNLATLMASKAARRDKAFSFNGLPTSVGVRAFSLLTLRPSFRTNHESNAAIPNAGPQPVQIRGASPGQINHHEFGHFVRV